LKNPSRKTLEPRTALRGQPPREKHKGLEPDLAEFRNTKKADMPRRAHNQS